MQVFNVHTLKKIRQWCSGNINKNKKKNENLVFFIYYLVAREVDRRRSHLPDLSVCELPSHYERGGMWWLNVATWRWLWDWGVMQGSQWASVHAHCSVWRWELDRSLLRVVGGWIFAVLLNCLTLVEKTCLCREPDRVRSVDAWIRWGGCRRYQWSRALPSNTRRDISKSWSVQATIRERKRTSTCK